MSCADRSLAVPTGWSHKAFGIPDDIAAQVDRTTLWALVSVSEALLMAGITDPYELYRFVHPSEVGSSLGSGIGGVVSLSKMFRDRREERDVQKDILQETYVSPPLPVFSAHHLDAASSIPWRDG